jgi:hypothetical protein
MLRTLLEDAVELAALAAFVSFIALLNIALAGG